MSDPSTSRHSSVPALTAPAAAVRVDVGARGADTLQHATHAGTSDTAQPAPARSDLKSPAVQAVTADLSQLRSSEVGLLRRARAAVRLIGAVRRCIRSLPVVEVPLTDGAAGQVIERRLRQRRCGVALNRLAQGILVIPDELESYSHGRRMQALRTNVRRARETMECRPLSWTEHEHAITTFLRAHDDRRRPYDVRVAWWRQELLQPGNRGWMVQTNDGEVVAMAVGTVDDKTAYLQALVTLDHLPRWLLHTHIVEQLHASGVRLLLTLSTNVLRLEPTLQTLQYMLGYTIANLRIVRSEAAS